MSNKHTPGPWRIGKPNIFDNTDQCIGIVSEDWTIADVWADTPTIAAMAPANATLMIAAPGMIEVLQQVKRLIDEALPKFNWADSCLDANAITLLNEVPIAVNQIINKALTLTPIQDCTNCLHSTDNGGSCMACDECNPETFDGWEQSTKELDTPDPVNNSALELANTNK